jgi:hypothetical protein
VTEEKEQQFERKADVPNARRLAAENRGHQGLQRRMLPQRKAGGYDERTDHQQDRGICKFLQRVVIGVLRR